MNSRSKQILYYILPSAGGLCVTYLYNIVDGIFVGQGVGALALAAVNITVPFITALVAISTLFAMGGSTVIAIRLGRGDKKGANDAFMTALVLTFLLSILLLHGCAEAAKGCFLWQKSIYFFIRHLQSLSF